MNISNDNLTIKLFIIEKNKIDDKILETRRFNIASSVTYEIFKNMLNVYCKDAKVSDKFVFKYIDSENDEITVDREEDFKMMMEYRKTKNTIQAKIYTFPLTRDLPNSMPIAATTVKPSINSKSNTSPSAPIPCAVANKADPIPFEKKNTQEEGSIANGNTKQYNCVIIKNSVETPPETLLPNQQFKHTWRVKNQWTRSWDPSCHLVFVGGKNGKQIIPDLILKKNIFDHKISPQEEVDVSVDCVAPGQEGNYFGCWKLISEDGHTFGPMLQITVKVSNSNSNITPTFIEQHRDVWIDELKRLSDLGFRDKNNDRMYRDLLFQNDGKIENVIAKLRQENVVNKIKENDFKSRVRNAKGFLKKEDGI